MMEKRDKREEEDGQLFVWQGYQGKVELISFKTFLTKPVRRVALGGDHSLILTYDDCLFACGSNQHSQLGCPNLGREYSFDPCLVDAVSGKGIQQIACGTNHSACIYGNGSLYIWGDNQHGQCARDPAEHNEVITPSSVELSVPGKVCKHGVTAPSVKETAYKISCGATHSMALTVERKIMVWGKGPQLGLKGHHQTWLPTVLETFEGKKVLDICSGDFHNAVLVGDGREKLEKENTKTGSLSRDVSFEGGVNTACQQCVGQRGDTKNIDNVNVRDKNLAINAESGANKPGNIVDVNEVVVKVDCSKEGKNDYKGVKEEKKDDNAAVVEVTRAEEGVGKKGDQNVIERSIYDVYNTGSNSETSQDSTVNEVSKVDLESVELRQMSDQKEHITVEDLLTASIRSDTSQISNISGRSFRSKGILDEAGAREFLARQFQDEDHMEESKKPKKHLLDKAVPVTANASQAPSSPGAYMMQTVTTLTSQVSSMTTKALGSIVSVPGKFRFSGSAADEEARSSSETLEVSEISELDTGSTENINSDKSILDFSNLTVSDTSLNASQLSLPESEKSNESGGSLESSPVKKKKRNQSNRLSVSKESQSIRTIEAKQENLRKRSLSLLTEEEKHKESVPTDIYMLDTEVWTWGRGNKGQLGLGDMLDRLEPFCIQILTGRRIVKLACGSQHTVALSSTGEVYSWGHNEFGQLGHSNLCCSPAKIELTNDCFVWSVDAGSNHSVYLVDNAGTQGTKPEVFFTGKHPCKDLYVPIYKTANLTLLKFLRKKAGWISSVLSGGDNCACISRQESDMTLALFEVTRSVRELHKHLQKITQDFVKRIQMSGFVTSLEVQPYKTMVDNILETFTELSAKVGVAGVELTDKLCKGESILTASLFTCYDEFVSELKKYSITFEDMVASGGFEYCTKNASSLFEVLQEFYKGLLKNTPAETKQDHTAKFRQIMFTPLGSVKDLSAVISKFSELYVKSSREGNLLSSVHLNFEHFARTSQTAISDADNTRMFWESSASKISDSLKSASRRLIKESRSCPLSLVSAGRFSTHTFYLFNDLFIHAQYSNYQSYPLETVWIDLPSTESSNHQNIITVTTPEDVLTLSTPTSQIKIEWVVAFNTAINKVIASQKSVNRQNSGERVHTPVIRLARHTFTKHALYREANYRGYWLNGKVHGSGLLKWPDGRKYRGKFKHGSITGSGKMVIPKDNGEEIQEGVWKDGKLHGPGKIKYGTGDMYEGYFKDAMRHGHGVFRKGRYLNSASFVYVGEWLFDKKHGYGVMDDILKGEKYMGMWQEDSRHGDGVVVTLDGMYFEGNFQHDKLVGHGLMLTDDNSCYEGEFAGITMLQGKGCLTFPSGDRIEGTFSGTWNQGLKISGTFLKTQMTASVAMKYSWNRVSLESVSSLYGKLCVKPDRKWEEIFYQCFNSLHYSGEGEPNTNKAWDQVVTCIVTGKQLLKEKDKSHMSSKQKLELSNLEQLEKVPTHNVEILTIEHHSQIAEYLKKAFESKAHPLGKLMEELVDVFRAAYIGIGAHPRLLYHAEQELETYIGRIYSVIRILFPELPVKGDPSYVYHESQRRASTPIRENMGFIQRQISEVDEEIPKEVVSAAGLLQPILLPKIYPALFDLYALFGDREDEKYWERITKLNKQGDMSLMAYLGIDQSFWCLDESMFQDKKVRISSIKDHSYSRAVDVLQHISTAFCPHDKLEVIQRTFLAITQSVQEYTGEEHIWCMDDLFPTFQFVVIRARIHHLGAEIHFIEELMESYLEFGELGIMFTTLKACYYQILNEKMPIH